MKTQTTHHEAVPPGYKKTEVGVIPEDWECLTVQNIASSVRNAIVGGPFGSDLVSNDYVEEGVPVIRGQNMGRKEISGSFVFVTHEKANLLESNLAHPNDLVFTQRGTLGQVCLVPESPFDRYLVSQSQMKLTVNTRSADPVFFLYVFTSTEQQELIRQGTIQTGVPHINLGILRTIPVQRPPLSEQKAIAAALSEADALIESLENLVAKKRFVKQGAMQELLTGKRRLPGFSGEWERKRLGDVVEQFIGGGTPSRNNGQYWNGDIPWVTVKDFATFDPFISQEYITAEGLRNSASHKIPAGTLITSTRMALGKAVIYAVDVAINQDLKALATCQCLSTFYLYFWFQYHGSIIDDLGSGSTVKGISLPDLKKVEIRIPVLKEQSAIASVLSDMDTEIEGLEAKLAKARMVKQGMMQELLTGRVRLV